MRTVAGRIHATFTVDELEREAGLYLVDDEIAADIADPLASIAHRRTGEAGKALNPDVVDGIRLGLGVLAYIAKAFADRREIELYRLQHGIPDPRYLPEPTAGDGAAVVDTGTPGVPS